MTYKDIVTGDSIFDFDDTYTEADGIVIKVECESASGGETRNIDTYGLKKSDYSYDSFAKKLKEYSQSLIKKLDGQGTSSTEIESSLDRYLREIDNREKISAVFTGASDQISGLPIPAIKKEGTGHWYLLVWEAAVTEETK